MESALQEICENFWLGVARDALGAHSDMSNKSVLEKIRPFVSELSDLFTVERPKVFGDYMNDGCLLAAYGLFFFPQSVARAEFAIRRLLGFCQRVGKGTHNFRILDLGSGASPCGFAFATCLREQFPTAKVEIFCVDRSRAALDAVSKLAKEISGNLDWLSCKTQVADLRNFAGIQGDDFDFIVLGWSLNEIIPAGDPESVEKSLVLLKKLASVLSRDGALVVLEPALKETAERLQRVGDYFAVKRGLPFYRVAPELGDHTDPMLAEGGEMWNHEVRRWSAPPFLEFLNRKLFREIGVLKFSWCALSKSPFSLPPLPQCASEFLRLISPIEITKASLRFLGANVRGEKLQIEIPTRGLSKSECKKLAAQWERGDVVAVSGTLTPAGNSQILRLAGTLIKVA